MTSKAVPIETVSEFGQSWDQESTLCLLSVNPNGLKYHKDWQFLEILLNGATGIGADLICLSETNTEWGYPGVMADLKTKLRMHLQQFRYAKSQSPLKFGTSYQPGDTLSVAMGSVCGHVAQCFMEPKGRWNSLFL
jgi:hypothetical protein